MQIFLYRMLLITSVNHYRVEQGATMCSAPKTGRTKCQRLTKYKEMQVAAQMPTNCTHLMFRICPKSIRPPHYIDNLMEPMENKVI